MSGKLSRGRAAAWGEPAADGQGSHQTPMGIGWCQGQARPVAPSLQPKQEVRPEAGNVTGIDRLQGPVTRSCLLVRL